MRYLMLGLLSGLTCTTLTFANDEPPIRSTPLPKGNIIFLERTNKIIDQRFPVSDFYWQQIPQGKPISLSNALFTKVQLPIEDLQMSSDGQYFSFLARSKEADSKLPSLWIVQLSDTTLKRVPLTEQVIGYQWAPTEAKLALRSGDKFTDNLQTFDVKSNQLKVKAVFPQPYPTYWSWLNDNTLLYEKYRNKHQNLYASNQKAPLTKWKAPKSDFGESLNPSPNGKFLLLGGGVEAILTGSKLKYTDRDFGSGDYEWSPDSKWLVKVTKEWISEGSGPPLTTDNNISVINIATGKKTLVFDWLDDLTDLNYEILGWSADSRYLMIKYRDKINEKTELWAYDWQVGAKTVLRKWDKPIYEVLWCPKP